MKENYSELIYSDYLHEISTKSCMLHKYVGCDSTKVIGYNLTCFFSSTHIAGYLGIQYQDTPFPLSNFRLPLSTEFVEMKILNIEFT